jgi:lysophospholipase L1-like esterase
LLFMVGMLVTIVYLVATFPTCDSDTLGIDYTVRFRLRNTTGIPHYASDKTFRVLLFGDSLINHPYTYYNMADKMKFFMADYKVDFIEAGVGGDTIARMKDRLDATLNSATTAGPLDAVVMLWDSDVSDVSWFNRPQIDVDAVQSQYIQDVTYVVSTIQQRFPGIFIALGGPMVMGEGPLFSDLYNVWLGEYFAKYKMYDSYREINKEICNMLNIPYIDLRKKMQETVPPGRGGFSGCLTEDGEHENELGTMVVANSIAYTVWRWIVTGNIHAHR